jgi:hypothetical protein
MNNIFDFAINKKDLYKLQLLSKVVTEYNSAMYRYTKDFKGRISVPKTELKDIPKKFINTEEYLNSKPVWKNILKFINANPNIDIIEYIELMIKNWNTITTILNRLEMKIPTPNIIFSVKMVSVFTKIKDKENNIIELNKHLNINRNEDFYRLTPSIQSNINSLFRLKNINPNMTYHDIISTFIGEFDSDFKNKILNINESDITYDYLINNLN